MLYVLAAVVAFVAVLGAWYISSRFGGDEPVAEKSGYLAAIQLTAPGREQPVAALLVVQDPAGGDPGVYLVPPDLLLEGPNGEYVFAADAMAAGKLADDLGRVVHAPIDAVYTRAGGGARALGRRRRAPGRARRSGGGGGRRPHADGEGRGQRRRRRPARGLLRPRRRPQRAHGAAGRGRPRRPRGRRPAAGGRACRARRGEPLPAGGPGALRGAAAHHLGERAGRAVPGRDAGRGRAVRLRPRRRGDPGRHHPARRPPTTPT